MPVGGDFGSLFNFVKIDVKSIGLVLFLFFLVCCIVVLIVFLIKKIKEAKEYIVLAEVVPKWSVSEEESFLTVKKKGLFKEKIEKIPVDVKQRMMTSLIPAKYKFNQDGSITLTLKTKPKIEISGLSYDYFYPLNYKKYKLYIKLVRYGALDFKPCKVQIEGLNEIRKIYDSDVVYIVSKTIDELKNKYKPTSKFMQIIPFIIFGISFLVFIITIYIISKTYNDSMKMFIGALGEYTNQLANLTKYLMTLGR